MSPFTHSPEAASAAELLPCPAKPANQRCGKPQSPPEHEEAIPPDGDRDASGAGQNGVAPRLIPAEESAAGTVAHDEHLRIAKETFRNNRHKDGECTGRE